MGASVCMRQPRETTRRQPLVLRYLLRAHDGEVDVPRANEVARQFAERPGYRVEESTKKHTQFEILT